MSRSVLFLFAFCMKGLFSVFKKNSFVRTCICIKVLDYNYFNCVTMGKLKLHKGYHIHKLLNIHKLLKRLLNFISVMKIMYKYNSICRDLVKKGISHPVFLAKYTLCFVHKPNITPVGSLPSSFKKHAHYYYITEVFNSQSAMAVHIQSA